KRRGGLAVCPAVAGPPERCSSPDTASAPVGEVMIEGSDIPRQSEAPTFRRRFARDKASEIHKGCGFGHVSLYPAEFRADSRARAPHRRSGPCTAPPVAR